jgi:glycerol-3-phosphate acyltransferase PlsY
LETVVWFLIAFLSGSIPFSLLVGKLAGAGDIRVYGDHNPGAMNVRRALGWRWFTAAMLLDAFKGAIPVGLAYFSQGLSGWSLILTAVAPLLGHAFSPWLRLRGGKAVTTTFGVWTGLTLYAAPILFGMLLGLAFAVVRVSGWAVLLAFFGLGVLITILYGPAHPEFLAVWLVNALVLVFKHREDLHRPPGLRPWLLKRLGRAE